MIRKLHNNYILQRRFDVLSKRIGSLIPADAKVLDVGSGSGDVSRKILNLRSDLSIQGIDVLIRDKPEIDTLQYDGKHIPFEDNSFDASIIIDVLHHCTNIKEVLQEVARVTKRFVIIKDHISNTWFDDYRLKLMDRVGNERFGVGLEYNYLSDKAWRSLFSQLAFEVTSWNTELHIYRRPLDFIFGGNLHFISALRIS